MLKNRPLIMLLTGLIFALALWGVVQLFQHKDVTPLDLPNPQTTPVEVNPNSPASIMSAKQAGAQIILEGTGVAGAGISLQNGRAEIARTKSSAQGNWLVSFPINEQAPYAVLKILMVTPDGQQIRSDQTLILIANPHKLAPDEQGGADIGKLLILLTAPGSHSRVLQTPYAGLPGRQGFMLEAIDYDNSGGVIFSGSSARPGKVRIYAGDNLVEESHVDNNGRWNLIFGNIMPLGTYTISAELVEKSGTNTRLNFPFARMQPLFESEGGPKIKIEHLDDRIQIGRVLFGGGYQYTVIYSPEALDE